MSIIDALNGPDEFWASFWLYFLLGIAGFLFMVAILPALLVLSLISTLVSSTLCGIANGIKKLITQTMQLSRRLCHLCTGVVDQPDPAFDDALNVQGQQSSRNSTHQRNERPHMLLYNSNAIGRWSSDLSSLTVQTGSRGRSSRIGHTVTCGDGGRGALQPLLFGCQRILFYNYSAVTPDTSTQTIYGGSEESSGDRAYLDAREELGSSSSLSSSERFDGAGN
uniref:Uncharacterized protein n=1 Tax=Odontella aurita TaxID=265563 RepID=A0A7S4IWQ0_9STRA|mmetsp:Transcript_31435/g.94032  ORF Transcript_31435/g.94032 Transcript_31435/m.94032 type:complete len:223 (+) Transcript_31435:549-1217(+)